MRGGAVALLLAAGLALEAGGGPPATAPTAAPRDGTPRSWRVVEEGIAIEAAIEPLAEAGEAITGVPLREGEHARFRIGISDVATGEPLPGLYPAAWMALLGPGEPTDPAHCRERIEEYLGGSILDQPELDLNVYYVLALNDEASISVVDPRFGFGDSRLLAMVELPSPGEDWVLTPDRKRLFVSLPDRGEVAVVDTEEWKVAGTVVTGGRPARLALQPDGGLLWVALDEPAPAGAEPAAATGDPAAPPLAGVAAIDAEHPRLVARVATAAGPHDLAVSDDNRFVFVTNAGAGTVAVIEVGRLGSGGDPVAAEVAVGAAPVSVAWSALAGAAYVADRVSGTVYAVDPAGTVRAAIPTRAGTARLRFAPGGRWGFALNPKTDTVHLIDAAIDRQVQNGSVASGPFQVTFSNELAYVLHRDSDTVLMIPLDEIGEEGRPLPVVDTPGGQEPFGAGRLPALADGLVRAPGADAVLIANPADEAIYFYKEGMAAPMGHFKNYGRQPRAVLVVDRSLRERTAAGVYETAARLRGPGRYQLAVFLDTPRRVHCFETEVAADPELEAERLRRGPVEVEPRLASRRLAAGQPAEVAFRLTDPATGAPADGLGDVRVEIYSAGGHWQQRRPAEPRGDGVYAVSVVPPTPGVYLVAVESPAGRLALHQSPQVAIEVVAPEGGGAGAGRGP